MSACPSPRAAARRCQPCSPARWTYASADVTTDVLRAAAGKSGDIVWQVLRGSRASSLATLYGKAGRYRGSYVRSLYAALGRLAAAGVPYRRERRLGRVVLLLGRLAEVCPERAGLYGFPSCRLGPSYRPGEYWDLRILRHGDFSEPCRAESWAASYARLQGQEPRSLACLAG